MSGRRIFLCYRRQDSLSTTGRLRDRLLHSGFDVLLDLDETRFGQKWRDQLTEAIAESDAMLVMIGPGWLTADDDSGRRRLDQPEDEVVREIGLALKRGLPLIPVMIDGTSVPTRAQLPKPVRDLVEHQVAPLHNARFDADAQALMDVLDPSWRQPAVAPTPPVSAPAPTPVITPPPAAAQRPRLPSRPSRPSLRTKVIAVGAAVVVIAIALIVVISLVTGPPRLSANALREHIPTQTRPSCQSYTPPEDPLQHDLRTAADCKPTIPGGPDEVSYLHYRSADAMAAAYASRLPDNLAASDCKQGYGKAGYTRPPTADGRSRQGELACFRGSSGAFTMAWTDQTLDVLTIATFSHGQSWDQVYAWWRDSGGPV